MACSGAGKHGLKRQGISKTINGCRQRTSLGNRREVMTEQHIFIGGMKIDAVVQPHRRRDALIVQLHHAPRNPATIKAKGEQIDAGGRHNQPEPIHFFSRIDKARDKGEADSAEDRDQAPQQDEKVFHARDTNNPLIACKSKGFPLFLETHCLGIGLRPKRQIPAAPQREVTMPSAKEQIAKILQDQPDDSSYDEILRELAFARMVERGLADSDAGRTISHEEMGRRIKTWRS